MKLKLNLILFLLFVTAVASAQFTKNVLFLGNSYTYVNDLPLIISKLAQSTGDNFTYQQSTPGGYTLQGHSTNSTSLNLIRQGGWDYVVLQEQSQKPSFPMSQVSVEVFPYAAMLSDSIIHYSPCAKPLFFMTWGRKYGDASNCPNWPPVCTYNGMDSLLNLRYRMMADSNDAYVSPVGAVWHYIRDNYASIDLYSSDNSHPSLAGSYAAACTFYSLIFRKDPSAISDDYGLSASDALNIRSAAKIIAYDSLAKWNVGKYVPNAAFSVNQSANTIQLVNQSQYADSYKWYFGDGDSSTVFEPSHTYAQYGSYNVLLKATKCQLADTVSQTVNLVYYSIDNNIRVEASIYPNPVSSELHLEFEKEYQLNEIMLFSMDAKLIRKFDSRKSDNITLDFNNIESGVYSLSFKIDSHIFNYRVVKI